MKNYQVITNVVVFHFYTKKYMNRSKKHSLPRKSTPKSTKKNFNQVGRTLYFLSYRKMQFCGKSISYRYGNNNIRVQSLQGTGQQDYRHCRLHLQPRGNGKAK